MEICPELKVHSASMSKSSTEKYLGDKLYNTGKCWETITDRKAKGYGAVTQILAITIAALLRPWSIKIGLLPRNTMLVNSMLFNSEEWQA